MRALILLLMMLMALPGLAAEQGKPLQLLARSQEVVIDPGLTTAEWRWVREHRRIRLAVWQPMSPPYDITTGLNDYGGINADFLGLVAASLGMEIQVIRYHDYAEALAALRQGNAEFLAQAGDNQRRDGLLLSKPYSPNTAVEVVNVDSERRDAVRSVAISPVYDPAQIMARYPGAREVSFSSARHAMESLAFRKIDLFFCDAITARYLISQSNLSNLNLRPVTMTPPSAGFSFAALPTLRPWITILNKVITALPESAGVEIHRRWNGGIPLSLSEHQPVFTSLEHKWIAENRHIRVAVAQDNAPLALFDDAGHLRGIIADILTALQLRTGFSFEIQRFPSLEEALESAKAGRSELVAGAGQEGIWRAGLLTTRSWLYNSWVIVGRANHDSGSARRVVGLRGELPQTWLQRQDTSQVELVDSWHEGLHQVVKGDRDVMVMPLIVANAKLARREFAGLKILAGIDTEPLRFAFGAPRQAWPLIAILNKALINIPPEDLHALTRNGYVGNSFSSKPVREGHGIWIIALAAGVLLLVAAVLWLRRRRCNELTALLEALPAPAYLCDPRGRLRVANQAMCDALGVSAAKLRGTELTDWFSEQATSERGSRQTVLYNNRLLRLWRSPVPGQRYSIGGWVDVTRERRMIQALRRAKRRADSASQVKSAFLAAMSHEIRTPISAIIGMLELVMQRRGDEHANQQSIRIAWDAAQSLLLLIGNILDVSRIESGRLVLCPARASLRTLIASSAALLEGLAQHKGLNLVLELDAGLNADVLVDATRLRQIIVNLVGNAIKFTDSGHVTLRAWPEQEERDSLTLRLEVEDSGVGIDEATLQRLFRPFEQGEGNRMAHGSGLGLYICRILARMMGGDVGLESRLGEGTRSTVSVTLPTLAALPEAESQESTVPRRRPALALLIVDDNPAGRMLLGEQLAWLGHRTFRCASGEEAIETLQRERVDAVISDCNMPGMDGYTLARTLRQRYPELPIFGVTADAREAVREAVCGAGMTDCLFKPVTLNMLEALLAPLPAGEHEMEAPSMVEIDASVLPAALLEGENLSVFLALQISVLDETLATLERWHTQKQMPLREALHRLRGGIQLLGVHELEALCRQQEQAADEAGIRRLEMQIRGLKETLQHWQKTGLQPVSPVLQSDEEEGMS
ncbi:transporter substrate-binding domain-containing protein [Erwinia sp. CPCC 100877]|nr:transporter substrate-binding domain-containing protein [Erwinia sp. CPCC 100877]